MQAQVPAAVDSRQSRREAFTGVTNEGVTPESSRWWLTCHDGVAASLASSDRHIHQFAKKVHELAKKGTSLDFHALFNSIELKGVYSRNVIWIWKIFLNGMWRHE